MSHINSEVDKPTDFKGNAAALLEELRENHQPVVLTINGRAKLIVQDEGSYQRLLELVERLDTIEGVKRGMESFGRGAGRPAREALEELRQKHNIPHDP